VTRKENINYLQDRDGNERKELDQLRGQAGMAGADGDDNGIQTIQAGDVDSDVIVYEVPDSVHEVILDLVHAHNSSGSPGTFRVKSATLDDNGNIDTTTRRSVLINVAAGVTRVTGYEGESFTEDAIVVESGFEGEIGLAVLNDHKEYIETDTENF